MIAKLEKQVILTQKTEALLKEISDSSKEMQQSTQKNVQEILPQIEKDVLEVVDYCKKTNIPKIYTVVAKIDKGYYKDVPIRFVYDANSWDIGICIELNHKTHCCRLRSVQNQAPKWETITTITNIRLSSENFDCNNGMIQYLCANWQNLKEVLINNVCEEISKYNEKRLNDASKILETSLENLASTSQTLDYFEEEQDERE